jgi:hypothetical protein
MCGWRLGSSGTDTFQSAHLTQVQAYLQAVATVLLAAMALH